MFQEGHLYKNELLIKILLLPSELNSLLFLNHFGR